MLKATPDRRDPDDQLARYAYLTNHLAYTAERSILNNIFIPGLELRRRWQRLLGVARSSSHAIAAHRF